MMDRKSLREFTHKAENFLSIGNITYKQWVFRYTFLELEKDLGPRGDVTTNSIFHENKVVNAKIIVKEDGIFAGEEEIKYFLVDSDLNFKPSLKGNFSVNFKIHDGEAFKTGNVILELSADIHDLLAVERTLLNLMMRMSGVATFTKKIVDLVKDYDVLVSPTRKTLWGLLDKKAVLVGGGGTHRMNLADAVLVKDNHLDLMGRDFEKVLQNIVDSKCDTKFVEIEVETIDEVLKASEILLKFLNSKELRTIGAILMDNMKASDVKKAISELKSKNLYDDLLFEVSGGINEKNVVEYAKTGVDIVSMGCLTSGIKSLDMGMEVE